MSDLPNGWIKCSDRHAPLYQDILVLCSRGFIGVGRYMAHDTYAHPRYPVLGQCQATHWQPLPGLPDQVNEGPSHG
jgi:hypothetical protein